MESKFRNKPDFLKDSASSAENTHSKFIQRWIRTDSKSLNNALKYWDTLLASKCLNN